jgi:hypothetical protein
MIDDVQKVNNCINIPRHELAELIRRTVVAYFKLHTGPVNCVGLMAIYSSKRKYQLVLKS